jgi:glycosyltransferase involved in cell wall biosynthesis
MISAVVITKNEEKFIETCLKSLKWVDEIIVADSGSEDKTLEIAQKYATLTFSCKGNNFSDWRTEAMEKAKGAWVLHIDSDERVLEPLRREIIELVSKEECSAYAVSRKNIIFGKEEKYGPFWPDRVVRLIKKSTFKRWVGEVHEYPEYDGKLGYTKNSLLHLTHRNLDQVVLKSLDWSKIDSKLRHNANHPKMSSWRFLRILFSELFNQGILRRGFFAGTIGTIDSLLQTFSLVMTYIRLWEMQQNPSLDKKYQEIDDDLLKNNFNF